MRGRDEGRVGLRSRVQGVEVGTVTRRPSPMRVVMVVGICFVDFKGKEGGRNEDECVRSDFVEALDVLAPRALELPREQANEHEQKDAPYPPRTHQQSHKGAKSSARRTKCPGDTLHGDDALALENTCRTARSLSPTYWRSMRSCQKHKI